MADILKIIDLFPWHFFSDYVFAKDEVLNVQDHIVENEEWERRRTAAEIFFLPFEEALQRSYLEQYHAIHTSLFGRDGLLLKMLIPDRKERMLIENDQLLRTIQSLPHFVDAVGDVGKTERILEYVLGDPILVQEMPAQQRFFQAKHSKLGIGILGTNLVLGDVFCPESSFLHVSVGPISRKQELAYLPGSSKYLLVNLLTEYLFPAEVELVIEILTDVSEYMKPLDCEAA